MFSILASGQDAWEKLETKGRDSRMHPTMNPAFGLLVMGPIRKGKKPEG
jgi:hypothetical protein